MRIFEGLSLKGCAALAANQGYNKPCWAKFQNGYWILAVSK